MICDVKSKTLHALWPSPNRSLHSTPKGLALDHDLAVPQDPQADYSGANRLCPVELQCDPMASSQDLKVNSKTYIKL